MSFSALQKIWSQFCIVEYIKNINICYIIAMIFQLHIKFLMEEHV
jgi:hypothetical protein